MSKIRINDLARELEVKSKAILDVLGEVGVTEKKTHSSSVEDHEAEKVRAHFRKTSEAQTQSRTSRSTRAEADEIKTKIDLSHISKPGDVLNLLRKQQAPAAPSRPPLLRLDPRWCRLRLKPSLRRFRRPRRRPFRRLPNPRWRPRPGSWFRCSQPVPWWRRRCPLRQLRSLRRQLLPIPFLRRRSRPPRQRFRPRWYRRGRRPRSRPDPGLRPRCNHLCRA